MLIAVAGLRVGFGGVGVVGVVDLEVEGFLGAILGDGGRNGKEEERVGFGDGGEGESEGGFGYGVGELDVGY